MIEPRDTYWANVDGWRLVTVTRVHQRGRHSGTCDVRITNAPGVVRHMPLTSLCAREAGVGFQRVVA